MPFSGSSGAWKRLAPLDPPLKVTAPCPRLIRICVYLQNLKTIISAQIIFKKCMQILTCIGKLYHRFQQNVPESESRQFDRLRLRLRLLARRHDSGRLRLRLRLRLRTPGSAPRTRSLCAPRQSTQLFSFLEVILKVPGHPTSASGVKRYTK